MAEEILSPEEHLEDEVAQSAPRSGSSLLSKLMMPLFVLGVVFVECAVAYVLLPNASETAALAGVGQPEDSAEEPMPQRIEPKHSDPRDQIEVDLGEFGVTAFQPISNTTLRINFRLYGTVDRKDEAEFEKLLAVNEHRFRDQVIVIVRGSELSDITEAKLGLIKRKILEKTNATLGKPLLQTIVFSEFSFVES